MASISSKITLTSLSEFTSLFFFNASKWLMISMVSSLQVLNLFLMLSMLSSDLPLVSPRLSNLSSITSSEHTRCSMKGVFTFSPMILSQVFKFSRFLGKPSMRNLPPCMPCCSMARCSSMTVISLGTIFPSTMFFSIIYPYCDPGCLRYARSRSPAERCTNLKSFWMCQLCVPLPEPGPPRMNTTVVSFCINTNQFIRLKIYSYNWVNIFGMRLRGVIEDMGRSIGDYFCCPAHIRGDVAERFDRSHIFHEITEFSIEEIVVSGGIYEGESPGSAFGEQIVQDPGFALIEVVVDDADGDISQVGCSKDSSEGHVYAGGDGPCGIGAFFPPVAAHEAEGEDQDAPPDHRAHEGAHIHCLNLAPTDGDVGIDEFFALCVCEGLQSALEREGVAGEDEDVGVHHAHTHSHAHASHHRVHLDHGVLGPHGAVSIVSRCSVHPVLQYFENA